MSGRIAELSSMLKRREISASELAVGYLSRMKKLNPVLNAYVCITEKEALSAAAYADRLIAEGKASALTGIPVALKDNISAEGVPSTCCSAMLRDYKPCYDAFVWQRLKERGAVLLGKTNMDEFAMGSTSETSVYGAPRNPVDTGRITGGSSGGSACAVKADLAVYALGSDTGGSVRQPASMCGVVGFKPTYGAVSRYGLIAYASSFDQIGPIAASVEDAVAVFDAIRGKDPRDMTSCITSEGSTALSDSVKGLKIGVAEEFFRGADADVKSAVYAALSHYESCGAEIVEIKMPSLSLALSSYYIIACAEASSNLGRYDGVRYGYRAENCRDIEETVIKTRSEAFGKEVKKRIMLGTYVLSEGYSGEYYKKACAVRESIRAQFSDAFKKCDAIISPSSPYTAFPLGYAALNPQKMYLADMCTVPANIAGLPAVSLPCGKSEKGLPIGMQVIADRFRDDVALSVANFFERTKNLNIPVCVEAAP